MRINGSELLEDLIPALMERDRLPYGVALDVTSAQRTCSGGRSPLWTLKRASRFSTRAGTMTLPISFISMT